MDAYIVAAARTPIGKFGGVFRNVSPIDLGAHAVRSAMARSGAAPEDIELAVIGNILRAGHGQNLARQIALKAGIPPETDGYSIDMVCSSGMMGVINAVQMMRAGDIDMAVAGGVESMSQSAITIGHEVRWGLKTLIGRKQGFTDTMEKDGLTDPVNSEPMGREADRINAEYKISRQELDGIAYESHKRAIAATDGGQFGREVIPVDVDGTSVAADEGMRRDTTTEKLAKLKPAFGEGGFHTAGNSSQISDGAAALVIASAKAVKEHGLKPVARVAGYSWVGIESWRFTEGPVSAIDRALKKAGMKIGDIDYFENNEAFAISSAILNRKLGIDYDRLNVFGGAIAMGHPIGASGARIITTLATVLHEKGAKTGLASICHGTGGATAVILERE